MLLDMLQNSQPAEMSMPSIDEGLLPVPQIEIEEAPPPIAPECLEDEEHLENHRQYLMERFHHYEESARRKQEEKRWDSTFRAYRGMKRTGDTAWEGRYSFKEIFRQVETVKPIIRRAFFSSSELFEYKSELDGFDDQARAATEIVKKQARKYGMIPVLMQWLDVALTYGTCFLVPGWQRYKRTVRKVQQMYGPDVDSWYKRQTEEIPHECPYLEIVKPWDHYSHPYIEDPRNSPVNYIRKAVSPADLITLVREGWLDGDRVDEAVEEGGITATDEMFGRSPAMKQFEDQLEDDGYGAAPQDMLICWTNCGWETVLLNGTHVLRCQRLEGGKAPIITQKHWAQVDELYGVGLPYAIAEEQRVLNDFMSMFFDVAHISTVPIFKAKRGTSGAKTAKGFRAKPGAVMEVDQMDDVVEMQIAPKEQQLMQAAQFAQGNMMRTTSVTNELSGTGSEQKTATGVVRMQQAAGGTVEDKIMMMTGPMIEVWTSLYDLNARYLSEQVAARWVGEDGSRFKGRYGPEAFTSTPSDDIEVQLALAMESSIEKANKWQNQFKMFGNDPRFNGLEIGLESFRALEPKGNVKRFLASSITGQADALKENQQIKNLGVLRDPSPGDDHLTHLQVHHLFTQTPEFAQLPPMYQQEAIRHLEIHLAYVQAMQKAQGMQQQAASGGQAQPGPGASGVGPEANMRAEANFDMAQTGAEQGGMGY